MSTKKPYLPEQAKPKTLIVGVKAPYNKTTNTESYFDEFRNLVKTNRVTYDAELFFNLRSIDSGFFFTKGKLEELKEFCDKEKVDEVIISEPLSPKQERNLKEILNVDGVYDRTNLILDIFEKAAKTTAGKLQVAIAQLKHNKSRLAGKGIHLAQQRGGIGIKGGIGETLKERQRRLIDDEIQKLKKQLDKFHQARETQRKLRIGAQTPHICLIGYTNAGKSTILNALTKADVLAEDKLFATLDTTTRKLWIQGETRGVISDTVGFIQLLPHHLVDAFKSTLSELEYADLLLHVVDISDPNWESQIQVVHEILQDLDVDKDMLYVFNKADKVTNLEELQTRLAQYQPHVVVSAVQKDGLKPLRSFLYNWKPVK